MTKKFNCVLAMGWSSDPEKITYGTLEEAGYLTKQKEYHHVDDYTITWTVVGDIEFTNNYGHTFKKGDQDIWET